MKSIIVGLFLIFGSLMSQAQPETHVTVAMPFDFMAGKTMFPAGAYTVEALGLQTFRLASRASSEYAVIKTRAVVANSNRHSRGLLFVNDGHHYRLYEIKMDAARTERLRGPLLGGQLVWTAVSRTSGRQPSVLRVVRKY